MIAAADPKLAHYLLVALRMFRVEKKDTVDIARALSTSEGMAARLVRIALERTRVA